MAKHSQGLHHHLVRKRIHAKYEPYPHPDRWKRYVDEAIYPIGVLAPLLTVPQLLEVWISKAVGLRVPAPDPEVSRKINVLLKKNNHREAAIKIIVTGGRSEDGLTYENDPTMIIITKEIPPRSAGIYEKGIKLITFEYQRNNPGAKTIDYITMLKLQDRKRKEKAFEILYESNGNILEGATSNFFLFMGDRLITPKNNVLIGITRNFIIKAAGKRFEVEERDVKTDEINRATEAFITSTTREILPVVKIDDVVVGNGRVGDNTKALMEIFKNYAENF